MSPKKETVLIVDDDIRILRMLKRIMELEGYKVHTADSGEAALSIFDQEPPAIVLLDIMMPDMDGYTVCERIREFSQIPIILVSAKSTDQAKVGGLDTGADDYITKPFSASELAARVRAALRRAKFSVEPSSPSFNSQGLVIDFTQRRVSVDNQELSLSATEYKILSYLACNANRIITPDQLLEQVWGEEYTGASHLLQVNIARLRQKLRDDARRPRYITTRPGIGYMMPK